MSTIRGVLLIVCAAFLLGTVGEFLAFSAFGAWYGRWKNGPH